MSGKTYSTVIENFLRYVKIDTQSLEKDSAQTPSTEKQRDLACLLRDELLELGASSQSAYQKESAKYWIYCPY